MKRARTLDRVLEPEVMDTSEEARDYDAMSHDAVNASFCADLLALGPVGPSVLDVGTGTALVAIELCERAPRLSVVAVDLAAHMRALAEENVARAGLADRVTIEEGDAKAMTYPDGTFATTMSNSLIHHIPNPGRALAEMERVTRPGGLVFVRDLARPASEDELARLLALYGGAPPSEPAELPSFERQRALFEASLRAALTVDEVTELARASGLEGCDVRRSSDRHWTLSLRKP